MKCKVVKWIHFQWNGQVSWWQPSELKIVNKNIVKLHFAILQAFEILSDPISVVCTRTYFEIHKEMIVWEFLWWFSSLQYFIHDTVVNRLQKFCGTVHTVYSVQCTGSTGSMFIKHLKVYFHLFIYRINFSLHFCRFYHSGRFHWLVWNIL